MGLMFGLILPVFVEGTVVHRMGASEKMQHVIFSSCHCSAALIRETQIAPETHVFGKSSHFEI